MIIFIMNINNIILQNFRNYAGLELDFDKSKNIFVGENAQGKTNLIEAIYLCAFARSFRTNAAADMIRFGSEIGRVNANITSDDIDYNLNIAINSSGKKMLTRDGKALGRTADLLNSCVVVVFSPEDLRIIKDSPEKRRNFINKEMSQLRPRYYECLRKYNDSLKQKNALLKLASVPGHRMDDAVMDSYDMQLADNGFELIKYRREFVKMLSEKAGELQASISGDRDNLTIEYNPGIDAVSREDYFNQLQHERDRDVYAGYATAGPHRDDISFYINSKDARKYASQGQQRTIALSLKLAEVLIAREVLGENPILLLDDVLSELDLERQNFLINQIADVQLFITSTDIHTEILEKLKGASMFKVEDGSIVKIKKY